ncbi:MAG: ferritin-like domain-containing protein [Clostridiaceae bacterium]
MYHCCSSYGMDFTKMDLCKSLDLIKEAVQDERNDELTYDYLIKMAPTKEEKEIIISIRNDERKHRKWFKEIYRCYTGKDIESTDCEKFVKPKSYVEGIKRALFGELGAVEKYRIIRMGLPNRYQRDILLEIFTDEMKHATKYNYILTMNLCKQVGRKKKSEENCYRGETVLNQSEYIDSMNAIMKRAVQEKDMGLNIEYLLSKSIITGILVGAGENIEEAQRQVEEWIENEEIGLFNKNS